MSIIDSVSQTISNNKDMLLGAAAGAGAIGVVWGTKSYLNKKATKKAKEMINDAAAINAAAVTTAPAV